MCLDTVTDNGKSLDNRLLFVWTLSRTKESLWTIDCYLSGHCHGQRKVFGQSTVICLDTVTDNGKSLDNRLLFVWTLSRTTESLWTIDCYLSGHCHGQRKVFGQSTVICLDTVTDNGKSLDNRLLFVWTLSRTTESLWTIDCYLSGHCHGQRKVFGQLTVICLDTVTDNGKSLDNRLLFVWTLSRTTENLWTIDCYLSGHCH
ncbi:hypothetical protein BgiBS90_021058 [Biomphalaria glabrata]|nr:hypothetical protein BgiBS90_021058 [Biomphalaria glabrata]